MAKASPREIFRQLRSYLIVNPTNAGLRDKDDPAHGGTIMGFTKNNSFSVIGDKYKVTAYEFGGLDMDYIDTGENCALAGMLCSWGKDAYGIFYPGSSLSHLNSPSIDGPVNPSPQMSVSKGVQLLVRNENPNGPNILMYKAVPMLESQQKLQLRANTPMEQAFVFAGILTDKIGDATVKQTYKIGQLREFDGLLHN